MGLLIDWAHAMRRAGRHNVDLPMTVLPEAGRAHHPERLAARRPSKVQA